MKLAIFVLFIVGVLGVLLATQAENFQDVVLLLPFANLQIRGGLLWMIAGWFGSGLLLGYLIALPGQLGAAKRARKAQKELAKTAPVAVAGAKASGSAGASETQALADRVAQSTKGL